MINLSKLMKNAHKIARKTVEKVGDYMIAFKLALKAVWKKINAKTAVERLEKVLGWNRWTKYGKDRFYFDPVEAKLLDVDRYNNGGISSASFNGEGISNAKAIRILRAKVFVDVNEDGTVSDPVFQWYDDQKWLGDVYVEAVENQIEAVRV